MYGHRIASHYLLCTLSDCHSWIVITSTGTIPTMTWGQGGTGDVGSWRLGHHWAFHG